MLFSGTKGQWPWDLVCSIGDVVCTRFAQMMIKLDLDLVYGKVKDLIPNAFILEKS